MKVTSPLANMEIGIGAVRREGNRLVLHSDRTSAVDTEISIGAREVLRTLGRVLLTPSSLLFVLGLPYFWWRERQGGNELTERSATPMRAVDINKPW